MTDDERSTPQQAPHHGEGENPRHQDGHRFPPPAGQTTDRLTSVPVP